jgi:transcriptional regulator with XRE-family HTH domain
MAERAQGGTRQMMTFGAYVAHLRNTCCLTQRDLASACELDHTYISKIEADKVPPPSKKAIRKMAVALDCEEGALLQHLPEATKYTTLLAERDAARADAERLAAALDRLLDAFNDYEHGLVWTLSTRNALLAQCRDAALAAHKAALRDRV